MVKAVRSKILSCIIVFLASLFISKAQNLVQNYSFENYYSCPTTDNSIGYIEHWGGGYPVYFSKFCTAIPDGGCPKNAVGYQYPHSGNAYMGIYTFFAKGNPDSNTRDYLQDSLLSALKPGIKYYVTFYVSLADSMKYACNNIGAFFSDSSLVYPFTRTVKPTIMPQVENDTANHLIDKINWMKVSGNFVAKGGEKFITIGNFLDDSHSDSIFVNSLAHSENIWVEAYYYVDDVIVSTDSNYADSLFPTAVQNISKPKTVVDVFPNPSNGVFTLEQSAEKQSEVIEVYNVLGEKIYYSSFSAPRITLNLTGQPSGIYLYRITSEKGEAIGSGKLFIQ
jgi:hypothetical protein